MELILTSLLLLPCALATQLISTTLHPIPSNPTSLSWPTHNSSYTLHYSTISSHLPHTHTNPHPHSDTTTIWASTATGTGTAGTGTISGHPTHNSTTFHSPTLTKSSTRTQGASTSTDSGATTVVVQTPASTWQGVPEAPLFTDAAFKDAVLERWRAGWMLTVVFGSLAMGL